MKKFVAVALACAALVACTDQDGSGPAPAPAVNDASQPVYNTPQPRPEPKGVPGKATPKAM